MLSLSVTAFAEETTPNIILELTDSYGDGWETATIKACLVKSDGSEEILREGMSVATSEATYEFTVDKFAVVRFYWAGTEEWSSECGVTIKRGGNVQYKQIGYAEEDMAGGALIFSSGYFDPRSTTVTYTVDPTYTVTIPATVALGQNATIAAENVVVEKGKQVEVALTDANGFTVATPQGAKLGYTVKNGETEVAEGDTVLAVNPKDGKTGETTLSFVAPTEIQYAGSYTGTVTFTVAVKDAPVTIINFTMDTSHIENWVPGLTQNLQAEAGMTWGEWVESAYNVDGYIVYQLHWIDVDVVGPNASWAISRDRQNYDSYVSLTDEIIAGHEYCFAVTGG